MDPFTGVSASRDWNPDLTFNSIEGVV